MRPLELTVISPLFNEEGSVRPLYAALIAALEPLGSSFEILLVDDGSTDQTFALAREIALADPRVRVIRLKRNFGQTAAMAAGFRLARGEILVTIDGDLQNDPADIPGLLQKIAEGADVVCGRRIRREDPWLTRKLPSFLANRLIALATGARIHDNGCTLRAYRPDALRGIPLYSEMHRLLPVMTTLAGNRVAEMEVRHCPRRFGKSKYGLSRIYGVTLDLLLLRLLLIFAARPLAWFGGAALFPAALGIAGLAWRLAQAAPTREAPELMAVGSGLLFLALAVYLLAVGIVAELACRGGRSKPWNGAYSAATATPLEGASPETEEL